MSEITDSPAFTIGIEEEYMLVDLESRDLVQEQPDEFLSACEAALGSRVTLEFMRSQIEVATAVCGNMTEARQQLVELRGTIAKIANRYGMAPIAASTHPFARWREHRHTQRERYEELAHNLQGVVKRMLICGMHVHCGIEDEDLRIDLMNQVSYFLPHLLALSTSSPFWEGQNMGLGSYRLTVFDGMPRSGLPERFDSYGEYQRLVSRMVAAGVIEDASWIWWDLRPSTRFPTLEMRMTDICTRLDDALAIAALYRCLLRMLYRLREQNQRWRIYPILCVKENRWRAQRYGHTDTLVDFGRSKQVPYVDLLAEITELIAEDTAFFDCQAEIDTAKEILERGASSIRQVAVYDQALVDGKSEIDALRDVVDWLVEETMYGIS